MRHRCRPLGLLAQAQLERRARTDEVRPERGSGELDDGRLAADDVLAARRDERRGDAAGSRFAHLAPEGVEGVDHSHLRGQRTHVLVGIPGNRVAAKTELRVCIDQPWQDERIRRIDDPGARGHG